jgi:uncharacterized OB-fold protein
MSEASGLPLPNREWPELAPLWRWAASGEFRLPRCTQCATFDWYPTGRCNRCGGKPEWARLSGDGTLFSWVHVHRPLEPSLAPLCPYLSAIVAIAEDPGTRFVTRLVDVDPAALRADMPVSVRFADLGYPAETTGIVAPLFSAGQGPAA